MKVTKSISMIKRDGVTHWILHYRHHQSGLKNRTKSRSCLIDARSGLGAFVKRNPDAKWKLRPELLIHRASTIRSSGKLPC
jgi:hypothetical protein